MENQSEYLFADDLKSPASDFVPEQFIKQVLAIKPKKRGKVISGTFGTFNIKEFERIARGLKDV